MSQLSTANKKRSSLYLVVILVFASAGLVFSGYGAFSYYGQKELIEQDIIGQTEESAARLAATLSTHIDAYQVNEYDKLVSHEIRTENHAALLAIIVDDYKMGAITGEGAYTSGWIRSADFGFQSFDRSEKTEDLIVFGSFFSVDHEILARDGEIIGQVRVYASDKDLQERTGIVFGQIAFSMLILLLVLSLVLILLLRHLFILPLSELAEKVSDPERIGHGYLVEPVSPYREISILTDAISNMLQKIHSTQVSLQLEHQKLEDIVDAARAGTWRWDICLDQVVIDKRWAEILGYTLEQLGTELSAQKIACYVHPDDRPGAKAALEKHFSEESDFFQCELRMRHKEGFWVWVDARGRVTLRDEQNKSPLEMVGTHLEISEVKAYQEKLRHIAHFDTLTGLPNRILLFDRLGLALEAIKRESWDLAVFFIDLDGFKAVNDEHGHEAGDYLLVEVGRRLSSVLRSEDTLARLGGDEFVAVLPGVHGRDQLITILERMIHEVNQPVIMASGTELNVTASIGVSVHSGDEKVSPHKLVSQADRAMYQAKVQGKNSFCFSDPA